MKSQRFDFVADDYHLPAILHAAGKSSITCGLEGISSRLRSYLHKSLDERSIRSSLNILLRAPLRELKIFLIATGLEDESDYEELKELLTFINEAMVSAGRKPRIIFSLTPLVRFPFTPLEFEPAPECSHLKAIIEQVGRLIRCRGFEFRTAAEIPEYAVSQILSRAYRPEIMSALINASDATGFIYYVSVSREFLDAFRSSLELQNITFESVLSGCFWTKESRVPVEINVNQTFIDTLTKQCSDFIDDGYCMGTSEREGMCFGCGACTGSSSTDRITSLREKSTYTAEKLRAKIKESVTRAVSVAFRVRISEKKRGISRAVVASALSGSLMSTEKRLVEGYRGFNGAWVADRFKSPWIYGDEIITLLWDPVSGDLIKDLLASGNFIASVNSRFDGWGVVCGEGIQESEVELSLNSPFRFDGDQYFRKNAIKYTSRRNATGVLSHELTPQSLKKKLIQKLEVQRAGETGCMVTVVPSEKFDFYQFLSGVFPVQNKDEITNIRIECRFTTEQG
ncbi:MAG: hypothetical protein GX640_03530 [Fibrobacter sp.]|nr:hypothetical protein [Fibrobacter sp.]